MSGFISLSVSLLRIASRKFLGRLRSHSTTYLSNLSRTAKRLFGGDEISVLLQSAKVGLSTKTAETIETSQFARPNALGRLDFHLGP